MSQGAKPTFQKRSKRTRDALVNALEDLLREKSFQDITVIEIANRAMVSPASIYRRFKNKDAFIPVLFEMYVERLNEWATSKDAQIEFTEQSDLQSVLRQVANVALKQIQQQSHIMKAVYVQLFLHPELKGDLFTAFERQSLASFKQIIEHFIPNIEPDVLIKVSGMMAHMFNTAFVEYALFDDVKQSWGLNLSHNEYANEMGDVVYGYVMTKVK